ncbi:hypothetical protein Leryth_026710 [Lithospermum erythrorhizon]|nr:hypothetical protein Leryth_026710 [Lithospermum erythrorhizon]
MGYKFPIFITKIHDSPEIYKFFTPRGFEAGAKGNLHDLEDSLMKKRDCSVHSAQGHKVQTNVCSTI